jgi:YHS domain-containing protein
MLKIVILILVGYFGFKLIKSALIRHFQGLQRPMNGRPDDIDVMIADPVCGVYFPKRSGVPLVEDGKTLYFCSTECRDKYVSGVRGEQKL